MKIICLNVMKELFQRKFNVISSMVCRCVLTEELAVLHLWTFEIRFCDAVCAAFRFNDN